MIARALLGVAVASCAGAASPPRPREEAPLAVPTVSPSSPDAGGVVAAAPPRAPSGPCRGPSFSLDHLPPPCISWTGREGAIPEGIVARLEASSVSLKTKGTLEVRLVLTNATDHDVTLRYHGCADAWLRLHAFDGAGNVADEDAKYCKPIPDGCGAYLATLVLSPGGTAEKLLTYEAWKILRAADECEEKREPLRPGSYELRATLRREGRWLSSLEGLKMPIVVTP